MAEKQILLPPPLAEHFLVDSVLRLTAAGRTLSASDKRTGQQVILKELLFQQVEGWKPIELFERETRTLFRIKHPRIPKLLGTERYEDQAGLHLYAISEKVQGISLLEKMTSGWRPDQRQACELAAQVLEILNYLHNLFPIVIHRDLKPSNLIITPSNEIFLVDFGAVKENLRNQRCSTVVGTFGYMAPEQYLGQAVPQSDLFGLGMTMIHLLSGIPPCDLPYVDLQLQFEDRIHCSDGLKRWLQGMIAHQPISRFVSAELSLNFLQRHHLTEAALPESQPVLPVRAVNSGLQTALNQPLPGSQIQISSSGENLIIRMPARWRLQDRLVLASGYVLAAAALLMSLMILSLSLPHSLVCYPFVLALVGIRIVTRLRQSRLHQHLLELGPDRLIISQSMGKDTHRFEIAREEIWNIEFEPASMPFLSPRLKLKLINDSYWLLTDQQFGIELEWLYLFLQTRLADWLPIQASPETISLVDTHDRH